MPTGSLSSCYYLRLCVPLRLHLNLLCSKNFIPHRCSHTFFSLSSAVTHSSRSRAWHFLLGWIILHKKVPCLLPGTMLFLCSFPQEGLHTVTYFQLFFPIFKCKSFIFIFWEFNIWVLCLHFHPSLSSSPVSTVFALRPHNFSDSRLQLLCVYACVCSCNLLSPCSLPVWRCVSGWPLELAIHPWMLLFLAVTADLWLFPRGGPSETSFIHISTATGRIFMWVFFG